MEYLTTANIITAVIVLIMLYFLKKLFTADIGENRFFYILALIGLGIGLYVWRSGAAAELLESLKSVAG
jgi:hypothetical protein